MHEWRKIDAKNIEDNKFSQYKKNRKKLTGKVWNFVFTKIIIKIYCFRSLVAEKKS